MQGRCSLCTQAVLISIRCYTQMGGFFEVQLRPCRYERTANDMLAKSTIAGQEGVITYLANAAALQQFEQTALAYVLMSEAGRGMGAAGLAAAAESLLEGKFEVLRCTDRST